MPATEIAAKTLRLKFLQDKFTDEAQGVLVGNTTSGEPELWKAQDLTIQGAIVNNGGNAVLEVTNVDTLYLEIRPKEDRDAGYYIQKTTTSLTTGVTLTTFDAGSAQQFSFTITDTELQLLLQSDKSGEFWVVVGVTMDTSGAVVPIGGGLIKLWNPGFNVGTGALGLLNFTGNDSITAGDVAKTITYVGMTATGKVFVQKTSPGPAIDWVEKGTDQFIVHLDAVAPATVTFDYKVEKMS